VSEQDAAIQDSMGPIQDRTREHLGPTDVAIVEFRKLLMSSARALQAGTPPRAAGAPKAYAVRAGGAVAAGGKKLDAVMVERFGDERGHVGRQYGLGD
jgi:hypothetical protein